LRTSFANPAMDYPPNSETDSPSPWGEDRGEGGRCTITRSLRIKSVVILLTLAWLSIAQTTQAQTVADPTISPASGTVVPVSVSMACTTPAAVIRYTLDGSVPTVTSPVFTTNLPVASLTMVRAKAFKTGYSDSGTVFAYYVEPVTRTDVGYYRSVTNT
jgi:guanyl-specific ribonuclease Sa